MRSRDGVLPASHLLSSKMQGNEVEAGNTPTVRSWEVYLSERSCWSTSMRKVNAAGDGMKAYSIHWYGSDAVSIVEGTRVENIGGNAIGYIKAG